MKSLVGATVGLLSLVGVLGTSVNSLAYSGADSIHGNRCSMKAFHTMVDMQNVVAEMREQIKKSKMVTFDTYKKMGYTITFLEKNGETNGANLKYSDRFAFTKGNERFYVTLTSQIGGETAKGNMDTICGQ